MLRVEAVSKFFSHGHANERKVLHHISFSMDEGEFVTVIGGNGAGKSTLMNCIAGTYPIDSGRIIVNSRDVTFLPEHRRSKDIGRVFQDPLRGTAFNMSIEENLAIAYAKGTRRGFGAGIKSSHSSYFRDRLSQLGLGLENQIKQQVGLLSGGQRQALTLLMATIIKPKMLLLDEHTAALDPLTADNVMKLTRDIVERENLCTLMITHNMKHALKYGSRTIMMNEGKIIIDLKGKERETMTVPGLIELFRNNSGTEMLNDNLLLL